MMQGKVRCFTCPTYERLVWLAECCALRAVVGAR